MPPRHAYWTIIVDDQPTSFRAHDVEELLPTFNRLREKHPSAQLKWFERGQLWESRDAAREHGLGQGERRWNGPRPDRDHEGEHDSNRGTPSPASPPSPERERGARADRADGPPRDKKWRPGGEHRDPRQKFKDAKKAKWDRYKENIRARWEERSGPAVPPNDELVPDDGEFTPPHGDPMREHVAKPDGPSRERRNVGAPAAPAPNSDRGGGHRDRAPSRPPRDDRGGGSDRDRNSSARPRDDRGGGDRDRGPAPRRDERGSGWDRGSSRPPRSEGDRGGWQPREDRRDFRRDQENRSGGPPRRNVGAPAGAPRDDRRGGWSDRRDDQQRGGWRPRPENRDRPQSDRPPFGNKPGARKPWGSQPGGARKTWGTKPGATHKPWGAKPGGPRKPWGPKPSGPGTFRKKPFGSGPPRGPRPKKRRDDEE
jgi:23S rRNA pseudouridine2605 synthase